MKNDQIEIQDPRIAELLRRIENIAKSLEKLNHTALRTFSGQRYLTDIALSKLLKISRRTLQEYRSAKLIPYYMVCGKVIYNEAEIQQYLEKSRKICLSEQELV